MTKYHFCRVQGCHRAVQMEHEFCHEHIPADHIAFAIKSALNKDDSGTPFAKAALLQFRKAMKARPQGMTPEKEGE